jgi:hypothetical protein
MTTQSFKKPNPAKIESVVLSECDAHGDSLLTSQEDIGRVSCNVHIVGSIDKSIDPLP